MKHVAPAPVPHLTETDLRLLRIFRAVAEAGGLTAAETQLGMERSTISRHLLALETRLGSRLCFRGPSGFELTDFGRKALQASIEWHHGRGETCNHTQTDKRITLHDLFAFLKSTSSHGAGLRPFPFCRTSK